jgi:hypothetical protein
MAVFLRPLSQQAGVVSAPPPNLYLFIMFRPGAYFEQVFKKIKRFSFVAMHAAMRVNKNRRLPDEL